MSRLLSRALLAMAALTGAASAEPQPARAVRPFAAPRTAAFEAVSSAALQPLPASAGELTFRGELSTQEHAVFLTTADALRITAFQMNYTNAVSNLPNASRLIVRINDQHVGEIPLLASARPMTTMLPLPQGVIVPGFNSVRLTAVQRHRVDCSAEATYELWTAVDPRQTGFVGAGSTQVRRLADLPALAGSDDGITRLRLRISEGSDTRAIARSMRVAQALVLLGWVRLPVIEVSPDSGAGPGIDLLVGTRASLADVVTGAPTPIEPELGLGYLRESGSERAIVTVMAETAAELDANIARLEAQVAQRETIGSPQGLRALANAFGRRVESGTSFRFADLGFETAVFDGALSRAGFQVMLPGDFFAAPYGKVRLRLAGSYTAEADVEGRLELRINDRVLTGIALEARAGDLFSGREVDLPLEAFRPGLNTVGFEARMRPRGQTTCDATARQPRARLVLGSASRIEFGQLARVGQFPRLSATFAHGMAYGAGGRPLDVHVSRSDAVYLDAAATIVMRTVASAQRLIPTNFRFGRVSEEAREGGLIVGPIAEAPDFVGLSPAQVVADAPGAPSAAAAPGGAIRLASVSATPYTLGLSGQPQPADGTAADAQPAAGLPTVGESGATSALRRLISGDLGIVTDRLRAFGLLPPGRGPAPPDSFAQSSIVVTQTASLPPGSHGWQGLFLAEHRPQVWTAVSAASPAALTGALDEITRDRIWHALDGARAIYRADQRSIRSFEPEAYVYVAQAETSLLNWRLVGAGWLSLNVQTYLIAISLACVLLGLFTAFALRVVRR